jgi:hypothetical protein
MNLDDYKKLVRSELSDITKTINRIYEDRDILLDIKTKVDSLELVAKDLKDRVFKLERNVRGDMADQHQKFEDAVSEVKDTMEEVKEVIGGDSNE